MAAVFGPRQAVAARELTKLHETHHRGRLDELAADPSLRRPKGEIVVVIAPGETAPASEADADAALADALARLGPAKAASEVAKALGLDRRTLYQRALSMKGVR
jgi:16S rRNA (cytidine1402-2'-O)-methyltransferase